MIIITQEEEDAFWTGVINGFGPPGLDSTSFMSSDFEQEQMPWYGEDLTVWDTQPIGQNTDIQYSYNVGYAMGTYGFGVMMFSAAIYAGSQSSYLLVFGFGGVDAIGHVALWTQSRLRSGQVIFSGLKSAGRWVLPLLFAYAAYDLFGSYKQWTGPNAPA